MTRIHTPSALSPFFLRLPRTHVQVQSVEHQSPLWPSIVVEAVGGVIIAQDDDQPGRVVVGVRQYPWSHGLCVHHFVSHCNGQPKRHHLVTVNCFTRTEASMLIGVR